MIEEACDLYDWIALLWAAFGEFPARNGSPTSIIGGHSLLFQTPGTCLRQEWIKVEPYIDYYKDPLAHALLEVTANQVTHSLTDPRQVYLLRWIAGRHANIPNFDPPYGIA